MCKKLSKINFALRILKKCSGIKSLKSIYYAHFQSVLMYGIEFWGQAADYLIYRVFKLQKQAIRILSGAGARDSCKELFVTLKILPLPALYIHQILVFFKKNPHYLNHAKPTHHYETRHRNNFACTKHKTSAFEKGAMYSGQILYNKLPDNLKNVETLLHFKKELKLYLLELKLYKVDKFINSM